MRQHYIKAAKKFIKEGYTSADIDKLAEEYMMLEEDAEEIREIMEEIEEKESDDDNI